jgi:tetratricopeptide (TPR) repeat protein
MRIAIMRIGVGVLLIISSGLFAPGIVRADDVSPQIQQATDMAQTLVTGFNKRDAGMIESVVDWTTTSQTATNGITVNTPGFREGFTQAFSANASANFLKAASSAGMKYHLLRVRQTNGQISAVIRALSRSSNVNYMEWFLGADATGRPKFVDVYMAATGERLSATERRLYLMAAMQVNLGMDQLNGPDKNLLSEMHDLTVMIRNIQAHDYADAVNEYHALSPELQRDKAVMVTYIMAAAGLRRTDPQEYQAATTAFAQRFPGDPAVDLVCLTELITSGQYDQARAAVDRLYAYVGGDPFLLSLKGSIDLKRGPQYYLEARHLFEESIKEEPTLHAPYWNLVDLSLREQDYEETVIQLNRIIKNLHLHIRNLEALPAYAGFVQSDDYRKWTQSQTTPTTTPAN